MVKIRIIRSEPALLLEGEKKYLVITDLHIGFENTFSTNKIFLGDDSSIKQITANVKKLIQNHSVDSVILLGDIKSSISQISFKVHRTSATIPMNITAKYVFENTKYFIG